MATIYTAAAINDFNAGLDRLDELGIDINSEDGAAIRDMQANNAARVREAIETLKALEAANVRNPALLGEELRLLGSLYANGLLTSATVNEALASGEVERVINESLIVRRPGGTTLIGIGEGGSLAGRLTDSQNQPVYYLRLFDSAALFIPAQLNNTLLRASRTSSSGWRWGWVSTRGCSTSALRGSSIWGQLPRRGSAWRWWARPASSTCRSC